MSNVLTPARVAATSTWLAGLGGLITGTVGVFPHAWQNALVASAGLLTKVAVAVKFMDGASNYETTVIHAASYALPEASAAVVPATPESAPVETPDELDDAQEFASVPDDVAEDAVVAAPVSPMADTPIPTDDQLTHGLAPDSGPVPS